MGTVFVCGNPPGCVCTSECEHPCMFRIGLDETRCCDACKPLPGDDDYVTPFLTDQDPGDEQADA